MIKVTVLGTSGSTPTKNRGMPSVALTYEGAVYLFDCGEGTQMKLMHYGINISKIRAIFISHAHGDHIIGVAGLIRTMALNARREPLYIFVPKGYERGIASLVTFDKAMIGYPVVIKGISGGQVYKGKGFSVSAFRLNHSIPTYGYVFKEDDKLRFVKSKAEKLGVKGTMFSELKKKRSIIANGRRITLGSVTYPEQGKKVVYATDTRPCASTVKAAKNADLLIHEAAFAGSERSLAVERKHSTSDEAALVAKKAKVKALVTMHISARYRSSDKLLAGAKKIFPNTVVASDGYTIYI